MAEKFEREEREQEILRDLDSLFCTWDLYPASRLPMWKKIVLNALCLNPGTEVDVDIIKKIGDQKYLPHSFIDEAVKYYGRFPFDTDKIPPPLKPAPERWKDFSEERRLPPELSRIVQCFLDGSGEETLSQALCRAILNAKNTRMLICGLLDMPSPDGNPVECELSLRSFFDEYEEPLLYAIFGDTRVTFHAVKTGPNSASVKLSFRHSFEWKDIMRNDLEKFFDTPQEKSGWIYRSTKLIGNISEENYALNATGGVANYKLQIANSGVASSRDAGGELAASIASSEGTAAEPASGRGEAATNPTGGSTPPTESTAEATPVIGPPSLQNMPGGPELLRNRIFDAFLRRTPDFKMTAGDMQLLLNSEALALRFRAYPPSGEPRKARLVFEEDKDNELFFALGEAYVSYSYQPEQKDGGAPHQETAETAAQTEPAPSDPVMLLKLDLLKHWEWIDLMRNGFDKYFPETKQRAEYAYSSLDVKGSATVEGFGVAKDSKAPEISDVKTTVRTKTVVSAASVRHDQGIQMSVQSAKVVNKEDDKKSISTEMTVPDTGYETSAQVKITPKQTERKEISIDITQIPKIMDANEMNQGAALMRHWFAGTGETDTNSIKIDWVIKNFDRARVAYEELISKDYIKIKAKREIIELAKKKGAYENGGNFGSVNGNVITLAPDYVQHKPVGKLSDPIDGLYAALGQFTFRVLVEGNVRLMKSGGETLRSFTIYRIGVYIIDSYNFNDNPTGINPITWVSQPLGYWNPETNYVGGDPRKGYYVNNQSFQDYRNKTGKGADFMIYSDIKVIDLSVPAKFTDKDKDINENK
jgi:hypothetical protein